jgi:hypothetical protein
VPNPSLKLIQIGMKLLDVAGDKLLFPKEYEENLMRCQLAPLSGRRDPGKFCSPHNWL